MGDKEKQVVLGPPTTRPGRWALGLAAGFLALFPLWLVYSSVRQIARPTFFSDPIHAVLLVSAALSAVLGGLMALWAVLREGERSVWILPCMLLAGLVAWWGGAEVFFPH